MTNLRQTGDKASDGLAPGFPDGRGGGARWLHDTCTIRSWPEDGRIPAESGLTSVASNQVI